MIKILITSLLLCFAIPGSNAAYWTKQVVSEQFVTVAYKVNSNDPLEVKGREIRQHVLPKLPNVPKMRNKTIAILLAILAIFPYTAFLGCGGLHRLYMGYEGVWLLQFMVTLGTLLLGGTLTALIVLTGATSTLLLLLGIVLACGAAAYIWQWIDFFRILSNTLLPKNGKWSGKRKDRNRERGDSDKRQMKDD